MTRRKGEIDRAQLRCQWPHHVTISADKVRGLKNSEVVRGFADVRSVAPLTYSLHYDAGDFVVFCFSKAEDAVAFCERFGGGGYRGSRGDDGNPHKPGTTTGPKAVGEQRHQRAAARP